MECLPGFTSISFTTCWTFGTFLARSSTSFFCFVVHTPFENQGAVLRVAADALIVQIRMRFNHRLEVVFYGVV